MIEVDFNEFDKCLKKDAQETIPTKEPQEKSSARQFIEIGSIILEENKLPTTVMMSAIHNAEVGLDMFMVGLAGSQAKEIQRIFNSMAIMEEELFDPEVVENLPPQLKIQRYDMAKESFAFRMNFIKNVNNSVDWDKLKVAMTTLSQQNEAEEKFGDTHKLLREKLGKIIERDYQLTESKVLSD